MTTTADAPSREPRLHEPVTLEIRNVSKRFGVVQALDDVSVAFHAGEVHALLGENGAGKSTLIKVIAGAHSADSGELWRDGAVLHLNGPRGSRDAGIAVVYQELTLLPAMTVEENLMLGHEPRGRLRLVDAHEVRRRAQQCLELVGGDIDPAVPVERLSIAQRQLVEVAHALTLDARVVLLDEPTSSLSVQEVQHLRGVISMLTASGVAVVLVTHDLKEALDLADRVTVLKDGKVTFSGLVSETDVNDVVRRMVGRDLGHMFPTRTPPASDAAVVLEARGLVVPGFVEGVDFTLRAGTVTGFIGLVGAGRSEAARALLGIGAGRRGEVLLDGRAVTIRHPSDAARLGIGMVPEDRKQEGLLLDESIYRNISLAQLDRLTRWGLVRRGAERALATAQMASLRIKAPDSTTKVGNLSGGNQQKVVLAKWLARGCRVLILDEPTRGIDVGAKAEIYRLIRELAAGGTAVMLISSEMPEVLHLADEVNVMARGRVTATFDNNDPARDQAATEEEVVRHALALESTPQAGQQDETDS
ncbi:sugar ABC transporter ATP-binding protein [Nocardioides sp.]|uniref:sugar ABC transporter ATP-binding protein n=1 Tax=Nocardioides sp. TaxID=35761 RepID=UPI0031FEB084|nr:Ribose transport system, ATP-binding protein RbsA [Nocardioides sp.]